MKKNSSIFIQKVLFIVCLLLLSKTYSQFNSTKSQMLFGKPVTSKNVNPKNGLNRCASTEYEKFLQEKNPKRLKEAQFEAWVTPLINKYKASKTNSKIAATIITIPVVVHVIYNGQAIGVAPNITDEQVQSQITVLNQDFRKLLGSPGYNTNPIGADIEIQFALAQQDPNGNPTNGIDRVSLCQPSWSDIDIEGTVKPTTIWDPTLYMNIWTLEFTDSTLLGYARFPNSSGLSGIDNFNGSANTDGVVSSYDVFGSSDYGSNFLLIAPYNKGRTMTHEIGHFLGLRHIWGDGNGDESSNKTDCTASDYCEDTPQVGWEHYSCGTFDTCPSSLGNDMPENYMDYTNDACMNIFTQNQKDRMMTVMSNSPRRTELKNSTKAATIALFANDAEVKLESSCPISVCGGVTNQTIKNIIIYNRGTTTLTTATLNYNINGGNNIVYNWSGSLATNKSATFGITINSSTGGTINVSIDKVNGVTDQRLSNNSTSGTFIIPTSPANYTFNTYKFTLQQDYFGSETTWDIKDGSGIVKYSGGPYTDTYLDENTVSVIPDLITQTWTLENNQCYTFTINDSSGDGICCGSNLGDSGDGYYNITSVDGLTTVKSGASFTSSESKSFTTTTLGTEDFVSINDVFLYPNPSKNTINIHTSSSFGLPNSYIIYNSLGQIVIQKKVSTETDLAVNTSLFSNGIYYITIVKEDQKMTLQFIKN